MLSGLAVLQIMHTIVVCAYHFAMKTMAMYLCALSTLSNNSIKQTLVHVELNGIHDEYWELHILATLFCEVTHNNGTNPYQQSLHNDYA